MLSLAADLDPVRAGADRLDDRFLRIELLAHLVEVRDLHVCPETHCARIGLQLSEDQTQQRRFTGAVRADEAQPVATLQSHRQPPDDRPLREALADVYQLRDQLARALAGVERELEIAKLLATSGAFDAQCFEPAHSPFIARAARFDAAPDPDFFLRPEFVELAMRNLFGRQLLALAHLVRREVAGHAPQQPATELAAGRVAATR